MKAPWSKVDFTRMVPEPLPFTDEDISECRRRFARLQRSGEAFSLDVLLIEPSFTPLGQYYLAALSSDGSTVQSLMRRRFGKTVIEPRTGMCHAHVDKNVVVGADVFRWILSEIVGNAKTISGNINTQRARM